MSQKPVLYGYSPSTYVRTVRMVLADNRVDYEQVSLDVLAGETRLPEHLARHPFGKVPVLDIDGMRLRETDPICRYVDETRDGPSVIPGDAKARAKMAEAISLYTAYGYVLTSAPEAELGATVREAFGPMAATFRGSLGSPSREDDDDDDQEKDDDKD